MAGVWGDTSRKSRLASFLDGSTDDTPEKARRFIENEITRWTPVIRSLGLKPG
jgi:hypothetical protein